MLECNAMSEAMQITRGNDDIRQMFITEKRDEEVAVITVMQMLESKLRKAL